MNLVEGIKRIYVVLFALIAVTYLAEQWPNFPSVHLTAVGFQDALKNEVLNAYNATHDQKIERNQIDYGDLAPAQFTESVCKKVSLQSAGLVKVCADYRAAIDDLPQKRFQYIALHIGTLLAISVCTYLLWLLLAWVGRGFVVKKGGPPLDPK